MPTTNISRDKIDEYKSSLGPLEQYIPGLDKIISGDEHHGRCPFCDELGDSSSPCFWVWQSSQRYKCRKCDESGDIITYIEKQEGRGLSEQLMDAGFIDEPGREDKDNNQNMVKNKKQNQQSDNAADTDQRTEEQKKFDFIWEKGKDSSLPYERYLEPARGIRLKERSPAIRWNSYRGKDGQQVNMILLPLTKHGDDPKHPQSILRVFLKKDGANFVKDSGKALNRERSAQTGRAVWFFPEIDKKVVGHGEGQETMLAVHVATGLNTAASLTTSGIKNVAFFPDQEKVFFFIDEDPAKWNEKTGRQIGCAGQINGLKAALRAQKEGLDAWVVTPTENTFKGDSDLGYDSIKKVDFNDLLLADPTGQSIRDRMEAAVRPENVKWEPPADKKKEGGLIDEDGKIVPQNHAAMLLADRLKGKFASSTVGVWYRFNGASWESCDGGEFKETVIGIMDNEAGAAGYSLNYLTGTTTLLQQSGRVKISDKPQNRVPFQNGMLDLKTKKFVSTTPDNAMQWHLPFDYNASSDCPFFLKWLNEVCNDQTGDTQWFIRAVFNALLVERGDLQYFVHFKGLPGTGKGTIIKIMEAIVGEKNKVSSDFKALKESRFETKRFYKKRLLIFNEVPKYVDIQTFLSITGRDSLRYELKRSNDELSYVYNGVVTLTSNDYFTTNDQTSAAIERRRRTVLFNKVFTEAEKQDWSEKGGLDLLLAEIPKIINWALEMTRAEVSDAFHSPPAFIKTANEQAEKANSPLVDFILSNVEYSEGDYVHIGVKKAYTDGGERFYTGEDVKLYPRYLAWCSGEGHKALARSKFLESAISMINIKLAPDGSPKVIHLKKKKYGGFPVMNIRLKPNHETEYDGAAVITRVDGSVTGGDEDDCAEPGDGGGMIAPF